MSPVNKPVPSINKILKGCNRVVIENDFPEILLKTGNNNTISMKLRTTAAIAVSTDSPKNCKISCPRPEPVTFLMPISFALRADLAVVKFI